MGFLSKLFGPKKPKSNLPKIDVNKRFELLGQSFIPQHSDARVLEQLIYKWKHSRQQIADALFASYQQLLSSGRAVKPEEISRDVNRMFSGNFHEWIGAENESLEKAPSRWT